MSKWEWKKLKDVCVFIGDGDWIESKDQSSKGIRLIQTGNIGNGIYLDKKERSHYISETTFCRLHCTEIFPGDCLISRLPEPIGRACVIPDIAEKMITAVDCTIVRFCEFFAPNFFIYYAQSEKYFSDVKSKSTGATRKRISRKNLENIKIPVPPLSEQKRIVKFLDEEFSRIDTLKTNAETNLKNTKELFETTLEKELNPGKYGALSSGWEWKKIGDVCSLMSGDSKANMLPDGKIAYVKVADMNLECNQTEIRSSSRFVDMRENDKRIFPVGTTIFPKRGGAILTNKKRMTSIPICCDLNIMGVIPGEEVYCKYLYMFFMGIDFSKLFNGASIPQINNVDVNPLLIPLPPLSVQKEIVARLDKLSENVKRLEANYKQIIANCGELKKSILKKTFEGDPRSSRE